MLLPECASNTIDRHHVSEILTNYPNIMNDEIMKARVAHSSTEYVCSAEYDYNFAIPKCLVVKLDAVVKAEKNKHPKSRYFNSTSSLDPPDGTAEEFIAYLLVAFVLINMLLALMISRASRVVSVSGEVYRMGNFYDIVKKINAWKADMKWLMTSKWNGKTANPELFDVETDSGDLSMGTTGEKHQALANEVTEQLDSICLSSKFCLASGEGTVTFE
ncbi:unnamed protein product [Phytophthora fragariaefolia]|uniref:Unnamed protein product n=1 Tax=Phytophthora fragariaefolia TaxID=1490495 RepID=A0A9W6TJV3_9STRA|nr:unnamed protein product [Phytophthora fragariaefolia]